MRTNRAAVLAIAVAVLGVGSVRDAAGQSSLVAAPSISSVAPQAPSRSASAQMLTITGTNLAAGLSLTVVTAAGQNLNYAGSSIQARRETSFQVAIILAAPGAYTLVVTNPDGATSQPFVLTGQPAAVAPMIDRVLPDQPMKDSQPQVLMVNGSRFVDGLSVSLTDPIGEVFVFKSSLLGSFSATSFTLSVVLGMAGDYSLMVTNPNGESSNNVPLKVVTRIR